jgi:hypothetical protein
MIDCEGDQRLRAVLVGLVPEGERGPKQASSALPLTHWTTSLAGSSCSDVDQFT